MTPEQIRAELTSTVKWLKEASEGIENIYAKELVYLEIKKLEGIIIKLTEN